jgi:hypothetical protein
MEACPGGNGGVPFGDTWMVSQICVEREGGKVISLTMFDVDWDVESSS